MGVTAARRADELGALLQRRGAAVLHAPALRIVPLADDSELLAATKELIDQAPDIVVATTAIGFRGWVEAADGWGLGEDLLARLRGVGVLARGPKVKGAVRAAGLTEEWSPSSESMAEVLDRLLEEGVDGRRIAIQLHGEPLPGFVESLRAGGSGGRRACPSTGGCRRRTSRRSTGSWTRRSSRGLDALTFTSAPAAASLLSRAEERGLLPELLAALNHDVLPACVGPVTALPLQAHGVDTVQPERFRLGPLVQLLCQELPGRARVAADRRAPGGDPRPRGPGRRRPQARAARRYVPAAGPVPPPGLGRRPRRPAARPAGRRAATSTPSRRRWPASARPSAPRS